MTARVSYEPFRLADKINTLKNELADLNKNLEKKVDQRTEGLHAANEELTAMNENLQAAMEELDAMNEKLIATNEELEAINDWLHSPPAPGPDRSRGLPKRRPVSLKI